MRRASASDARGLHLVGDKREAARIERVPRNLVD
jgi:hypothetical protein